MQITRVVMVAILAATPVAAAEWQAVSCEGAYRQHLQGVCSDGKTGLYWCFTSKLVKTDAKGKIVKQVDVDDHHGDLCFQAGKIYVAVNLGKFNDPKGNARSWVYVYDAADLSLLAKHPTPEVFHGAGGIAHDGSKFLVVGGLPEGVKENYLYEYNARWKFVKKHILASGHTQMGIQTAAFADGQWWFGCYGKPQILLRVDAALTKVERFEFNCSYGIVPLGGGKFLVARGGVTSAKQHTGRLVPARADRERGLVLIESK